MVIIMLLSGDGSETVMHVTFDESREPLDPELQAYFKFAHYDDQFS